MIDRFLLHKDSISKALVDLNLETTKYLSDISKLNNLLSILKPVRITVQRLGKKNKPSSE